MKKILTTLLLVALLGAANPAMAVLTYALQPVAPTGITDYTRCYDIVATTDNNGGTNPPGGLAVQDMIVQTTSGAGSIYQDAFGADTGPPTPAQIAMVPSVEFDTYVTMPVSFGITGYAVDLGSSGPQTFSDQFLDVAWAPSGGAHTGPGSFTIARLTLADWAAGTYTIGGFEEAEPPDEMSPQWGTNLLGSFDPLAMSLSVAEVVDPTTPTGYTAYDFFAKINSNMGIMELLLSTTSLGDIYQNSLTADDPDDADAFDTFITVGYPAAGEQAANTHIWGGAVDIGGAATETFDTQNIDIAWSTEAGTGNEQTGHGTFRIARVTLKNGTIASYKLQGYQGGDEDAPVNTGDYGNYPGGMISLIPGDVNGDGWVSGTDLSTIISYWGQSGLGRTYGDLNADGTVEGNDYTEVLSYWGTGSPPPPPEPTPEPATIGLLVLAGVGLLARRRR